MKRFLSLYSIEQKLALRSCDMLIFGVFMPVGILVLISVIAGSKMAGEGYTYLEGSFASLIAVGVCAMAFMGIPLTIADYRDKKILKHFFATPCSPAVLLLADVLCCFSSTNTGNQAHEGCFSGTYAGFPLVNHCTFAGDYSCVQCSFN